MNANTRTLTLAASLLLFFVTPAAAQVVENAPGAMCVSATPGDVAQPNSSGQMSNTSDARATFVCPAERVRDGGNFSRDFAAMVFVRDQHPEEDVCCRVVSQNPAGRQTRGDLVCSEGTSSSYQILSLPGLYDNTSWSHFFVRCGVPPVHDGRRSAVLTYRSVQDW